MKKYVYTPPRMIPDSVRHDVEKIVKYCRSYMDTEISIRDAYQLWSDFSDSRCAGWLTVNDGLLKDHLPNFMKSHGYFIES